MTRKYGKRIRLDMNEFTLSELKILASRVRHNLHFESGADMDLSAKILTKINRLIEVIEKPVNSLTKEKEEKV